MCFFFLENILSTNRRVLVVLDRQMSSSLGRPCAIQDEEWVYFIIFVVFSINVL